MQEMIPFVGPQTDIMGPDMGTNEQIMAWFMDTYSVYHGLRGQRNRHRQTGRHRWHRRPSRSTGRGVVYLVERAMNMLKMDPEKCTAIVQGSATWAPSQLCRSLQERRQSRRHQRSHRCHLQSKGIDVKAAEQHMIKKGNLRAFAQDDQSILTSFSHCPAIFSFRARLIA